MAARITLNVSLSPALEAFVAARVASGRYQTASEVIRDGLRLLEERELARESTMKGLRDKIAVGLDQIKKGQVHDGTAVFETIKSRSRKHRGKTA